MAIYDIIMPALLILMTLRGLWKGLIHQIASLLSVFLSLWVATQYADRLAPYVGGTAPTNQWVAMLVLYIATSFLVWIISGRITALLDKMKLGGFDHQMGALLGLFSGVILCMVITFFVVTLSEQGRQMVLESRSGYWAAHILEKADQILPEKSRGYLSKYIEQFQAKLGEPSNSSSPNSGDNTTSTSSTNNGFDWLQWARQGNTTNSTMSSSNTLNALNAQNGENEADNGTAAVSGNTNGTGSLWNMGNTAGTGSTGNTGTTGDTTGTTSEGPSGMSQLFDRFRSALGQSISDESVPASTAAASTSSAANGVSQTYTPPSWW